MIRILSEFLHSREQNSAKFRKSGLFSGQMATLVPGTYYVVVNLLLLLPPFKFPMVPAEAVKPNPEGSTNDDHFSQPAPHGIQPVFDTLFFSNSAMFFSFFLAKFLAKKINIYIYLRWGPRPHGPPPGYAPDEYMNPIVTLRTL